MSSKVRRRYQPLDWEIGGYLKTFLITWLVCWIVILIFSGLSWYTFWGGLLLALIPTFILYFVFLFFTGVKDFIDKGGQK